MFPAEWSFPISMHIPTITVICLNKTRQEITRRLLHSKCIASKYLTNEQSSSYKSRPAPPLHLDKVRNLKVIAQLSYRALCPGDEFQTMGHRAGLGWQWHHPVQHPQLPSSPGGSELLSSISFHLRKAQVSRVFQVHMTLWAGKTSQTMQCMWDDAGEREEMAWAMAEGRWRYRDNWAFTHTDILLGLLRVPLVHWRLWYRLS